MDRGRVTPIFGGCGCWLNFHGFEVSHKVFSGANRGPSEVLTKFGILRRIRSPALHWHLIRISADN